MRAPVSRSLLTLLLTCLLTACDSETEPIPMDPPDSGVVDTGCPAPAGAAVMHSGTVANAETWSASSPHVISDNLSLSSAVTVEPCAVVSVAPGRGVQINSGGALVTQGTQGKPVRFQARDPGKPWGQVLVNEGGSARLTWTTLSGGGEAASVPATVRVRAGANLPGLRPLFVDHVTIEDSGGAGVMLNGTAGFAEGSTALTITRSGGDANPQPLSVNPNALGTLPSGTYTGNRVDAIAVGPSIASATVSYLGVNATLKALGVPYLVEDLTVGNHDRGATLIVEAGAELRFAAKSRLLVYDGKSALIAAGTQAQPVVFTSASPTPAAGDWAGLRFEASNPANRLEHVRVRYAGGPCLCSSFGCNYLPPSFDVSSAVLVFQQPATAFIVDSTLEDSAGHGILSGWNGSAVDLTASNTFARIVGCAQTVPRDSAGNCPSTPPSCPRAP